jgi:hypothetical protein
MVLVFAITCAEQEVKPIITTICPPIGYGHNGNRSICAWIEDGQVKINDYIECGPGEDCSIVSLYEFIYDHVTTDHTATNYTCSKNYVFELEGIDTSTDEIK